MDSVSRDNYFVVKAFVGARVSQFLLRVSTRTHNIAVANLSACLCVCPWLSSSRWKRLDILSQFFRIC